MALKREQKIKIIPNQNTNLYIPFLTADEQLLLDPIIGWAIESWLDDEHGVINSVSWPITMDNYIDERSIFFDAKTEHYQIAGEFIGTGKESLIKYLIAYQ
jgi:hypothetical protein